MGVYEPSSGFEFRKQETELSQSKLFGKIRIAYSVSVYLISYHTLRYLVNQLIFEALIRRCRTHGTGLRCAKYLEQYCLRSTVEKMS